MEYSIIKRELKKNHGLSLTIINDKLSSEKEDLVETISELTLEQWWRLCQDDVLRYDKKTEKYIIQ